MADTYTAAGLAVAGCGAVASALAYVFRSWNEERGEWNKERTELLSKIGEVQAARVTDAQKMPQELATLAANASTALSANTEATKAVTRALSELREGVEELPEEVIRSIKSKHKA